MNRMEIKRKQLMLAANILGIVTMAVLARLIGDLGMAYFAGAAECYILLQIMFLSCVPDCMAKMVRSRIAKGQYKNVAKVYRTSFFYCIAAGLLGSFLLFGSSGFLMARLLHMQEAVLALKILAPAFFVNAVIAVLQGYFEGIGTAMPSIIAGIIKQIFFLTFAILFGWMLFRYGEKVSLLLHNTKFANMYGAAGVAIGLVCAGVITLCFLFLVYLGAGRRAGRKYRDGMRLTENGMEICRLMLITMVPLACQRFLLRADTLLGLAFYQQNQTKDTEGLILYGAYYGKYLVFTGLLIILVLLSSSKMDYAVIHATKKEEYKSARDYLSAGIQSLFLSGAFFAAISLALSPQLMNLIFGSGAGTDYAALYLRHGFLLIIALPMGIWFFGVLMTIGKRNTVLLCILSSFLLYILFSAIGLKVTGGNPIILVYAKWFASLLFCLLGGFFLMRLLRYSPDWLHLFVFPTAACAVTGLCVFLLNKALVSLIGELLTCIICILAGGFCYLILILVLKCVREKDLSLLPGGKWIRGLGSLLHLI